MLAYQAGTILQESDRYLDRLSRLLATATKSVGGERLLISLGAVRASEESPGPHGGVPDGETDAAAATGDGADQRGGMSKPARLDPVAFLKQILRSNRRLLGGWLVTGIGGIVGLIGSAVICLSFVFYLLQTRSEWINRLLRVLYFLGLRPRRDNLERIREHDHRVWGIRGDGLDLWGGRDRDNSLADRFASALPLGGHIRASRIRALFRAHVRRYTLDSRGADYRRRKLVASGDDAHGDPRLADPGGLCHSTDGLRASCPVRPCHGSRCNLVLWLVVGAAGDGPDVPPVMVMLRELAIMSPETPALDALMEPHQSATTSHASH